MRIWTTVMGQRLDNAENTRSMLLCAELLRRGHDVVMWTSAYDHIRKEWRKEWKDNSDGLMRREDGLEIRFMRGCGYSRNVGPRRIVDHWLAARDFIRQAPYLPQPDVIVASLPDHITAAAAVSYGKQRHIATILDLRDKWPDVFADYVNNRVLATGVRIGLFRESARAARALRETDAVVAMMKSMLTWGLNKAGRTATWRERIFYLTTSPKNYDVQWCDLPAENKVTRVVEAVRGKVVFTFIGTFNRTQHPMLILDAVDCLSARGDADLSRFAFIIAGDGIDAEEVERRAASHTNVHYVGWLKPMEMNALLSRSDVGMLVMNFPSPAFNNKAFAYLASGLPILNGASGDLAEIIDDAVAGINVKAGDSRSLADAIIEIGNDGEWRSMMAKNVRDLFERTFDRESNYRAYADHVERVAEDVMKTRQ